MILSDLIEKGESFDEVIAIGPVPMMKAVVNVTKPKNIKTSVSFKSNYDRWNRDVWMLSCQC